MKYKCIFCLEESDNFNTIEHIVSESLGNTDDILEKAVCDKCQNYFGREIENYILSKSPFGFWRTISGTLSKKGKCPSFDGTQSIRNKGKIDDYHEYSDKGITIYPGDNEKVIQIDVEDVLVKEAILSGEKQKVSFVMTPKMLIYMGRFLGKIALEYWCKEFKEDIFDSKFDEMRKYVRYGTVKTMWPIFSGKLEKNLLHYRQKNDFEEERILYAYKFYQIDDHILFCFDIGTERYGIILTERLPDGEIFTEKFNLALCEGTVNIPNILYYNL